MMKGRQRSTMDMGHDAFLDIVANLVGILIILVVVLGTQTQRITEMLNDPVDADSVVETAELEVPPMPKTHYAAEDQLEELAKISIQAATAQRDGLRLEQNLKRYDAQIDQLRRARGQLLDLMTLAEEAYDKAKSNLDERKVLAAKRQREIREVESQIAELASVKEQLGDEKAPLIAVEHLPTPMAKLVYGDEIYFRLKGGRLSVVPVEPLLEQLKERVGQLKNRQGINTLTAGPIRDYTCSLLLEKSLVRVNQGGQVRMGMAAQAHAFRFEPVNERVGQTVQQILGSSSFLDIELAGRDPKTTTITVSVYEDSYGELRQLKEHLYARGFATAARPLLDHQSIVFSPTGTVSKAQ
ncbi:hypothetical protein [Neorhodopirellula lusitana]|uniref:hypothetical protein n=1 Tax=Neorhodopirellula lusitana TaxID=445327 RepID=UPI00384EF76E